ncbi:hypothetical protein ADEAN_000815000 [Angomonas deanei]|uniref:Uncharacterized protein n=1 Tax=Angomonas deanei TaxID=59799 RepID=A0A7G2CL95_9TRYP|nr:hypothetical protein ADEAN_000815000 [Angomonas deanei]
MFPGLLQEEENENNNNVHHRSGLHWCLLPEEKEEYCCQPRHSSSHCRICHPFTDTVREEEYIWKTNSTLLLLLQEYIHGRQNRVNLSEFKSDLINKLSLYFVENNDYRNLEEYKRKAKALLFAYLKDYNNKSDYFDDYKQKTAEKRNEKILQLIGKKTAFSKKGKQNNNNHNNNQTVELSEEEVHTTLIEVLHSVGCSFRLPPRNIIYEYYKNKLENNDNNNNNTIHYTLEVYFSPPPILPSVMPTKYYHGIMADYHKRRFCKRENRHNPSRVKEEETERLLF